MKSQGPYVIVNTLAGEAWGRAGKRLHFATRAEAVRVRRADLQAWHAEQGTRLSAEESTIMTLAQYLIEYGVEAR